MKKIENLKVLKSEILDSLNKAKELEQKLVKTDPERIDSNTSEKDLIAIGYFLSGIYSNFEEIFTKIAKEFENKIEDPTQWHAELLNRMTLEIEEVRPAVISKQSQACLHELLKFRHVFRFSYSFELDWEKILFTVRRWYKGAKSVNQDLEIFLNTLDQLVA